MLYFALSGVTAGRLIKNRNPAGFCVVLSYSKRTFWFFINRLVVAPVKSQDHRETSGVFSFGATHCGTSVDVYRDTPKHCRPDWGAWAKV